MDEITNYKIKMTKADSFYGSITDLFYPPPINGATSVIHSARFFSNFVVEAAMLFRRTIKRHHAEKYDCDYNSNDIEDELTHTILKGGRSLMLHDVYEADCAQYPHYDVNNNKILHIICLL